MKRIILLIFLVPVWGIAQDYTAISCEAGAPSKLSYFSSVVRDQCGHVNTVSTGLLFTGTTISLADYGTTKYYLAQPAYVNATGAHEANPFLRPLLRREPLGGLFTLGTILAFNGTANWTARHHGNERLSHAVTIVMLGFRGFVVVRNYRAYRAWERIGK